MAEDQPSLHIDTDWKRQAQEEKKRLAEEQAKRAAERQAAAPPSAAGGSRSRRGGAERREMPPPSFTTLVQSIWTQVLLYLGELALAGGEPMLDLDRAKHQLDTLAILDEKTNNNLTEDERKFLDSALYEARSRFISVASQFI